MYEDSVPHDRTNYVKLSAREKFRFDGDFSTQLLGYLGTMALGAAAAMFLFSFLPNVMEVFAKGYQPKFILEHTMLNMWEDFFPRPSAIEETPKAWAIPFVGAAFAACLRMFYKAE